MNTNARPSAAARLDRLPISSFHRDIVKLLAYIFFFELGDLNSFAFAAPGVRQHVAPVDRHDQRHHVRVVCRHVHRRDLGRLVLGSRRPQASARRDDALVLGVFAAERIRVGHRVALRDPAAHRRRLVVDDRRRDDLHQRDVSGEAPRALSGDHPDRSASAAFPSPRTSRDSSFRWRRGAGARCSSGDRSRWCFRSLPDGSRSRRAGSSIRAARRMRTRRWRASKRACVEETGRAARGRRRGRRGRHEAAGFANWSRPARSAGSSCS